ncbi:hypothetical protein MVEN_01113000 [Mycena venus]|uniref:Uncharacterized protein n=1 Tax=Mycena venus TaxID=2733690 RepID=A0A8H7CXT5_9AGAR|nr:hypothetical protein MVEN_01113000 [Mycena venus]
MESSNETCLFFEKNSLSATTIALNNVPTYKVSTNLQGSTTKVRSAATNVLIAHMDAGKSLRISKWLERTTLADGTAFTLRIADGEFFLRSHHVHRLAFYGTDQASITAHWNKLPSGSPPLTLIVSPGLERSHAQIIAAFIYSEQKM